MISPRVPLKFLTNISRIKRSRACFARILKARTVQRCYRPLRKRPRERRAKKTGPGEQAARQRAASMAMDPPKSATNATDFQRTLAGCRGRVRRCSAPPRAPHSRISRSPGSRLLSRNFAGPVFLPARRFLSLGRGISASFESCYPWWT